jgi:hypothetical protein
MIKKLLIIGVVVISGAVSGAQTRNDSIQQLQQQVVHLENYNSRLSKQVNAANLNINKLEGRLSSTIDSMEVLKKELALTNNNLEAVADNLEFQIRQLRDKSNSDYSALSRRVNNITLYWIMAMAAMVVISVILISWLRSRLTIVKTELSQQIKSSSEAIREDFLKLDNKLFWTLDLQNTLNKTEQNETGSPGHSLALKVADEIIRIQKNLSNMDQETKGLKQVEFAVERIQDNFKLYGYEMVELLNKPYDQEMKISAKFKTDDTLKRGEQIITRIIKPQVNYNNVIIQEAQVEVSVGNKQEGSS